MLNRDIKPYPQPLNRIIGDRHYRLAQPFRYQWIENGVCKRIVVPSGFEYDGASVPRIAWSVIGLRPSGLISAAACVHDFCYAKGGKLGTSYEWRDDKLLWRITLEKMERHDADKLFKKMMHEAGITSVKRLLAYQAVRWFGGNNYED